MAATNALRDWGNDGSFKDGSLRNLTNMRRTRLVDFVKVIGLTHPRNEEPMENQSPVLGLIVKL